MPVYRLDLEYDGAGFNGWQVQPARRTVQGELGAALERLCGAPVRLVGAGRTDAGVHALGQVASFETERDLDLRRTMRALAALLPEDIRVWRAGRASPDFSARASALSRSYSYRLLRRPSPLGRGLHAVLRVPVDVDAMAEAAAGLVGRHDFTAFVSARTSTPNASCEVRSAVVVADALRVRFDVTADRFLHNMVRRLTGALVEVGRGRLTPAELRRVLEIRDRSRGGPCLPACGLFLVDVSYPPDPEFESSAVVDGPRWAP